MNKRWIGVDLDGTLAEYDGWKDGLIGKPIIVMRDRIKRWLDAKIEVRIVTARVSIPSQAVEQRLMIERWCEEHLGQKLQVTCQKDFAMLELWDDRAVRVTRNNGLIDKIHESETEAWQLYNALELLKKNSLDIESKPE